MRNIDHKATREFTRLELLARQVVEGFITGLHKSPFHGFSVEFAEHRLYNTGESVKNIDWKLYARTDRLFIKRFEEETNLRCQLVIDCSGSMYFPENESNKIHFAVHAAASMMQLLKRQRDAVGLSLFSDNLETHLKARSSGVHHKLLINHLERILQERPARAGTRAVQALHQIAEAVPKRSLVTIFSDMFDDGGKAEDLFAALQHLRYKKHEVVLFHVMDEKHEVKLEYDNRPYVFEDLETGERLKLNPAQVKEEYERSVSDYRKALKLKCAQYRIDFIEVDIHKGFDDVLLAYLTKRKKML